MTGSIWATTGTMAANHVTEHEQGQLAGVNVALSGLMSMLGPLWAGTVYDHRGQVNESVFKPLNCRAWSNRRGLAGPLH